MVIFEGFGPRMVRKGPKKGQNRQKRPFRSFSAILKGIPGLFGEKGAKRVRKHDSLRLSILAPEGVASAERGLKPTRNRRFETPTVSVCAYGGGL